MLRDADGDGVLVDCDIGWTVGCAAGTGTPIYLERRKLNYY